MNCRSCIVFFIALALTGCASYSPPTSGPTSKLEITRYRNSFDNFGSFVVIKVDGEQTNQTDLVIKPGRRDLIVYAQFVNGIFGGGEQVAQAAISMNFEANKTYKLNGKILGTGSFLNANYSVQIWIEDAANQKVVSPIVTAKTGGVYYDFYVYTPAHTGR